MATKKKKRTASVNEQTASRCMGSWGMIGDPEVLADLAPPLHEASVNATRVLGCATGRLWLDVTLFDDRHVVLWFTIGEHTLEDVASVANEDELPAVARALGKSPVEKDPWRL